MVKTAVRSYSEVLLLSDFIRPHAIGKNCCAFIFWGSVIVAFVGLSLSHTLAETSFSHTRSGFPLFYPCNIIKIQHECGIEKPIQRITEWHHEAFSRLQSTSKVRLAEWWQSVIARDGFFYPILTRIMDSFSCSPHNYSFILEKRGEYFQKILNTLRCDLVTSFKHYNAITDRRAASVQLFVFYLSLWLVQCVR